MSDIKVEIRVPCNVITAGDFEVPSNSVVARFKLYPSTTTDWITKIRTQQNEYKAISALTLLFESADKKHANLERYQSAVLVVEIEDDADVSWRFAGKGIVLTNLHNTQSCIRSTVFKNGKELHVTIDNVDVVVPEDRSSRIDKAEFQYIAYREVDGNKKAYLSQDPSVGVGRVKT